MSWLTAHPFPPRQVLALYALVSAAMPAYAQNAAPPSEDELPITLLADEIDGRPDRRLDLSRNVEITRGQTGLTADTACYLRVEDEVTATGNVSLWRFGDRYKGDELQLNLETGRGYFLNPSYFLGASNGQGHADRIDFLGEQQAVIRNGTYSTCQGTDPDWYLKSSTLRLDQGRDVGTAGKTIIYFKGVPIIGTPAISFSLSGQRRSGWLPPSIGFGSQGKAEIMVPYYVNIAPNRDLTLYPRMMFDRGMQLGATGRYMGLTDGGLYSGETHIEVLPDDRKTKTTRWRADSFHRQAIKPNWSFGWNLHGASDDEYPSDFSRTVSASAERQLLREISTDYQGRYWSLGVRAQNYQVLQDPGSVDNPALTVARPYDRLPQVNFHTGRYDVAGFDWSVDAEATRFWHPDLVRGNRAVLQGQVSFPIVRPGWFVTPKVMINSAKYDLDKESRKQENPAAPLPSKLSRTLPTYSLDSGLIFERDMKLFGRSLTQTLEPRLFYVYTPYKDQSDFPIFDTARAGFNYAQLFSENRYVGLDRVSDAEQVTTALVSRFVQSDGAELLRLAIGQRLYLSEPRVRLPGEPNHQSRSDLLLAAGGRISETWSFDSGVQYDATGSKLHSSNLGVQWRAGPMKVVNAEYRYQRDSFRNIDLSAQWPLSKRWYGVGRVSYALRSYSLVPDPSNSSRGRKLIESLIGLEYKADCWVFRMGAQRFVTASQTTSTPIFFQLELNGLSRLGLGNPLESFNKSVPGYTQINSGIGRP